MAKPQWEFAQLTYAGVPLCIDTQESNEFIAKTINFDDVHVNVGPSQWPGTPYMTGLTYPNKWMKRPKFRPGCWFYPTGVTRWGEFHCLITNTEYDKIVPRAFPATPLPFVMEHEHTLRGHIRIETPMYALPPRPLGKFGTKPGLFLLTLVDERYYFMWKDAGNMVIDDSWTWERLLGYLANQLGISLAIQVPGPYLQPQGLSDLYNRYENAAVLLDAAAYNVGCDVVRNLDGTYKMMTQPDSRAQEIANTPSPLYRFGGGDMMEPHLTSLKPNRTLENIMPTAVRVTFPKRQCDIKEWDNWPNDPADVPDGLDEDTPYGGETTGAGVTYGFCNAQRIHMPFPQTKGDVWVETITIEEAGFNPPWSPCPGIKYFHDTCEAWYITCPGEGSPLNRLQLHALALQTAIDFYWRQLCSLDETFQSIYPWFPEGNNDITWQWSKDDCYTRVQRKPLNWQRVELLRHMPPFMCASSSLSSAAQSSSLISSASLVSSSLIGPSFSSLSVSSSLASEVSQASSAVSSFTPSSAISQGPSSCTFSLSSQGPTPCFGQFVCDVDFDCFRGLTVTYDIPVPIGAILLYAGTTPPAGWLLCDGTAYAATTYPVLFSAIGYTWGGSCGTFQVPNLVGQPPLNGGMGIYIIRGL